MREMVFVYGTLRKGGAHHHLLEEERDCGAALLYNHTLYDLGRFPAAGKGRLFHTVTGEVFFASQDTLKRLDHLEGVHRGLFRRERHSVVMESSGNPIEAWVYVWVGEMPKTFKVGNEEREVKPVESGIWTEPKFLLES